MIYQVIYQSLSLKVGGPGLPGITRAEVAATGGLSTLGFKANLLTSQKIKLLSVSQHCLWDVCNKLPTAFLVTLYNQCMLQWSRVVYHIKRHTKY